MKNYYSILELSPNAKQDKIREQYHLLLHAWHPDKFPNPEQKAKADQRTKEINEAYSVLSDPNQRAKYDRELISQSPYSDESERQRREEADRKRRATEEAEMRQQAEYERKRRDQAEEKRQRTEYERRQREQSKDVRPLSWYLNQAESLANSGNIEQAVRILEDAYNVNPAWAKQIAGFPCQTILAQSEPVSGYGLLVHLAGKTGRKNLAVQYVKRMLELNPKFPGDGYARQAAREAKVEKEAKKVALEMGFSWRWWEY